MEDDFLEKYPKTELFRVVDIIATEHPYCITARHLKYNDSMYLGKKQIEQMESKHGAMCGAKGCNMLYSEHTHALLVEVNSTKELNEIEGLNEYLMSIKSTCEKDGYVGFAFKQKKEE